MIRMSMVLFALSIPSISSADNCGAGCDCGCIATNKCICSTVSIPTGNDKGILPCVVTKVELVGTDVIKVTWLSNIGGFTEKSLFDTASMQILTDYIACKAADLPAWVTAHPGCRYYPSLDGTQISFTSVAGKASPTDVYDPYLISDYCCFMDWISRSTANEGMLSVGVKDQFISTYQTHCWVKSGFQGMKDGVYHCYSKDGKAVMEPYTTPKYTATSTTSTTGQGYPIYTSGSPCANGSCSQPASAPVFGFFGRRR